jgi:AraC-like DNA-binding protein/ligand-binding sensor protein
MNDTKNDSEKHLIERLKASPFYQACQNAFRDGTGLPLIVQYAHEPDFNPCHASKNQNSFCQLINSSHGPCAQCVMDQDDLFSHSMEKAFSHTCFAGLKESAVPLRLGHRTIGFLRTGQVFTEQPTPEQIKAATDSLDAAGYSKNELKQTLEKHKKTPVYDQGKYSSTITLLSIISLQLTEFLNRLLLEVKSDEPEIIRKAKSIIADHIDEKITLSDISSEVHVSVFYFCKVFKQSTGMTFTEYVNRQRIELAKGELKKTGKPVTEIAYAVGFQSLSHFNRCFLKFAGESPRQYRQHVNEIPTNLLVSH